MQQFQVKLARAKIHTKQAMTLLEVMVMILVLSITLTAMFTTLIQGMNLQRLVQQRIQAANIAREGIEGIVNIRNTNWLRFSSNRTDCWKVKGYDATCITDSGSIETIETNSNGAILFQENGLWKLTNTGAFDDADDTWIESMNRYRININEDGWYSGTGTYTNICNSFTRNKCKTPFSREIKIKEIVNGGYEGLEIKAIVRWRDSSPHTLTVTQIITNWKKHYDN